MKRLLQQAGEEAPNSGAGGSYSTASPQHQQPGIKALSQKEREAIDAWRTHVEMGHYPYRRDCGVCVEAMGRDRPRKRMKGPEPFTLSLDVAGPFVPGKDQMEIKPKYFVVATMTIPMLGSKPMVESLRKLAGDDQPLEVPEPPVEDPQKEWDEFVEQHEQERRDKAAESSKAEADAPKPDEKPSGEDKPAEDADDKDDPFKLVGRQDQDVTLTDAQIKELDAANQRWKEFMAGNVERPVKTLTLAIPTKSKKSSDVVKATAQAVARPRALHIPINRVHTDRGKEFIGGTFRSWLAQRDYFHTTTAGDEPSSNSRAESEINVIKCRARVLMKSAQCDSTMWPLAVRHASEERFRRQLQACGVPTPALPFGVRAVAKQKSWQHRYEAWRNPMTAVRVWGPAWDMSMTSRGYFLEVLETGKMMRSTVVVVPKASPMIVDDLSGDKIEDPPSQPEDEVASVSYAPSVADGAGNNSGPPGDEVLDLAIADDEGQAVLVEPTAIELELAPPEPTDMGIPVHDPPLRRMTGKQPPRPHERWNPPILRKIGGEWNTGEQPCEAAAEEIYQVNYQAEKEDELRVLEHSGLAKWAREERLIATDSAAFSTLVLVEDAMTRLENQLEKDARMRKVTVDEMQEEEILQTRVVPLDEVRQDLAGWKDAFQKEYDSLLAGPVGPITDDELQKLEAKGEKIEILPAKKSYSW